MSHVSLKTTCATQILLHCQNLWLAEEAFSHYNIIVSNITTTGPFIEDFNNESMFVRYKVIFNGKWFTLRKPTFHDKRNIFHGPSNWKNYNPPACIFDGHSRLISLRDCFLFFFFYRRIKLRRSNSFHITSRWTIVINNITDRCNRKPRKLIPSIAY